MLIIIVAIVCYMQADNFPVDGEATSLAYSEVACPVDERTEEDASATNVSIFEEPSIAVEPAPLASRAVLQSTKSNPESVAPIATAASSPSPTQRQRHIRGISTNESTPYGAARQESCRSSTPATCGTSTDSKYPEEAESDTKHSDGEDTVPFEALLGCNVRFDMSDPFGHE